MIQALIIIRFKQITRALIEIGFIRFVFLIALIAFLSFVLFVKTSEKTTSQYISIGFLVLFTIIHLRRKDKLFLKTHFYNYKNVMLIEYLLASIPLVFCLLFHGQWIAVMILIAGLPGILQIDTKPKMKSLNTKLQNLIPMDCFEWKAGIRKQFFILIPVWIIAAGTSFFIASVPIAVFIIGISSLSFYETCEPLQILQSYELGPGKFLMHKLKRQFVLFTVVVIPLIILFLIFHFAKWYIPVAEYGVFVFLQTYIITVKYAFYEPNAKSPAAQTFGSIGALGGLIPIFQPVIWVLTIWFYIKSIDKLDFYLHDYN